MLIMCYFRLLKRRLDHNILPPENFFEAFSNIAPGHLYKSITEQISLYYGIPDFFAPARVKSAIWERTPVCEARIDETQGAGPVK